MGCSERCCRAISFLQPHEKSTVIIKLPSTLCSFWLRCLICHKRQRCLINHESRLDEHLQKSTWVSPQKGVAEACCGKHYAETLSSSPSLGFCFSPHRLSSRFRTDASKRRSSLIYLWYALTFIQLVAVH